VNAASLGLAFAFSPAARVAAIGTGFDIAFGYLVPPLLLGGAPDFLSVAVATLEENVAVAAAFNKVRNTIAVVRGE